MGTVKTKTREIPCASAINMPPEALALSLMGISFADAASIFSDETETASITVSIGESTKVYNGFTKLGMIRRVLNGLEVGLQR